MTLRRIVIWTLVALAVIAPSVAGWRWWKARAVAQAAEAAAPQVAAVSRGRLRQTVQCTGRVVSNLDVDIKCRASGEVTKLPFDVSDVVKKNDLLLELDPIDQQRMVEQAQATLAASKAKLEQAKSGLATSEKMLVSDKLKSEAALHAADAHVADTKAKAQREKELVAKKYSSPEEEETARTAAVQAEQDLKTANGQQAAVAAEEMDLRTKREQINLSQAQVDSDSIALDLAQRQLSYTKVVSPLDAVVTARNVQIGTIISSGISNVGGGTTVLTLSDLSHIYILGSVDESDIGAVVLGQKAEITADAYPRKRFKGSVNRIAAKGVNTQNVVTFEVRIEAEGDNKTLLKPEMTTNDTIVVADKADILKVPATAIMRERAGSFVTLATADGKPGEKKQVEIGITDNVETEIAGGLNEGDKVIVQRPENESRWKQGDQPNGARQQMMMMRTMGGGGRR